VSKHGNLDHIGRLRFYGIYKGVVMDTADPINKRRIRVQVPQVLGQEISGWATPCLPVGELSTHSTHPTHSATITTGSGGTQSHTHSVSINLPHSAHTAHAVVPAVNQGVWVMFEAGDPDYPVWMGVYV
jgi:hypothetical protein